MASGPQSFYCLWQEERIRETLFDMLPKEDICSVRLANSACCNLVTKRLFMRTHLAFTANTFTKISRVQALSRIGHHIEHLTFYLEHSDATFLPPLLHPQTGREISFLYTPHTCMASVLTRPKYANSELGDILTQQYPPLFHAATNVPSFLNAMKHMPNIRHLTIKCPGQDPKERYRRNIVDYALISLRISIERAPMDKLCKLSLSGVHPAAFNYLRHVPGFGSHPSGARRWRQIRKLYMSVDSWDFYGPSPGLDHLKIIDDFVRNMAPHLEKFSFTWLSDACGSDGSSGVARKGPCPIALSGDSLFSPRPEGPKKLFNEVTGPMSPLPPAPRREPMYFPRLRCLTLRNATMNTPQLRDLVDRHSKTVREFEFENVSLTDGGSYEDAFYQLLNQKSGSGNRLWSPSRKIDEQHGATKSGGSQSSANQSSPTGHQSYRFEAASFAGSLSSASSTVLSGPGAVASPDDKMLSSPSAAVSAVSRELLDMEVEDLENYLGLGSELPFMLDSPSDVSALDEYHPYLRTPPPPPIAEVNEEPDRVFDEYESYDEDGDEGLEDDGGLASDIAAAHEDSLTFTTRFKKRRVRRSHRKHHSESDARSETEERRSRSHRHHHGHHRHRSDQVQEHPFANRTPPPQPAQLPPSNIGKYTFEDNIDDDVFQPLVGTGSSPSTVAKVAPLNISAPILVPDPLPVVLQPTVYDPSAMIAKAATTSPASGLSRTKSTASSPRRSAAADATENDGLTAIQRQILQQEQAQVQAQLQHRQYMADDADARTSALRKAKEAVLAKLSREFSRRMGRETTAQVSMATSAASVAAAAASVSMGIGMYSVPRVSSSHYSDASWNVDNSAHSSNGATAATLLAGLRLRERLFGDSLSGPASSAIPSVPIDYYQHRSMESNSAVVPLIFSRA
ncbi:MAG: hypothetical protein STHCBS139747_005098 [Sporothrix thermara]